MLSPAALAAGASKSKKHHRPPANCVSAVCVYTEQLTGANGSGGKNVPLSSAAANQLGHAAIGVGERHVLKKVATSAAFGVIQRFPNASQAKVTPPGMLLAAFDLGSGPIALFGILLGCAAAVAAGRVLRRHSAD